MRLRAGRPDLTDHRGLFDVPVATGDFSVTFLGVSTLLFDDGETRLMVDGFFSRPSLLRVGLGRIAPDPDRIDAALQRTGVEELAAVIPVHSHFDHAMDAAFVARRTGADLVGGSSTAEVGRGGGLAEDRIVGVADGDRLRYGDFTLTFRTSAHCPPDRYPGEITAPVVPPVRAKAYRCGEAWSVLVEHSGAADGRARSCLVQGSAGYRAGALDGHRADVAYLGVGQLGIHAEDYLREYWAETVTALGVRHVVLTHWDDFFSPLDRPLRALPYAGDDLDHSIRVLGELARSQGVTLHLPTVFRPEDPWELSATAD